MSARRPVFLHRVVDELTIEDERSFHHVALYDDLKEVLRSARVVFRVLPAASAGRADRALLLNLTFWAPGAGDILVDERIDADVLAHAAWHHLAASALASDAGGPLSADALLLGESIASAFDLYLVGRLLGHAPRSTFLETRVPAMADAAEAAGLAQHEFERLLREVAADPDRAFAELRELLFDAASALHGCANPEEGYAALAGFDGHRFASLLHRYELSNWVLYARAYAGDEPNDERARAVDRTLREEKVPLDWLATHWVSAQRPDPSGRRSRLGPRRPRPV